jgi:Na+-driven multidrug efflux pump
MNVILDIVFIVCFHWGVAGAAWATVMSQAVSGILCIIFMFKKFEILRIRNGEWVPERKKMFTLYNMGLPMGLQYSITAIGSTVLQSAINGLGAVYVAATAAGTKIYSFLACPIHAMGSAMATYGGQNIGARKLDRIGKGMKACVIIGAVYSVIAFLLSITLGKYMAMLFVDPSEYEVIKSIQLYVNVTMAGGFLIALVNGIRFLIQGIGFPKIAMMAGVMEMIARIFIGFVLVPAIGYMGVALSCPIAWIFADAFLIPAYFGVMKRLRREEAANEAS